MADLDDHSTITVGDDRPLAVRRQRRSSAGPLPSSRNASHPAVNRPYGIATPPATPKRSKKKVRFSDPGPLLDNAAASTGLTPFIRRTSLLSTPKSKRRQSTPARLWNRAGYDVEPISGTLQFAPLRQVLDGRVKRRIRRNGLSEEVNVIEWEKRVEARERKSEVERLRAELAMKDLEVQSMRDDQDIASQIEGESGGMVTTSTELNEKVQELEQEIQQLKEELGRKEVNIVEDTMWTPAQRSGYDIDDDDMMITNYDDDFENNDEIMTTPTRLNTSFPSPPSTMPNTPCKSVCSLSAGIQADLPIPDPENEVLRSQLLSLQAEISKLSSAVAFNEDNKSRLAQKLADFIPLDESHDHTTLDSALDKVLTQLALSQSHALEHRTAFSALSTEITNLGFSASSPDQALEIIARQFRQARLDLEYLTPGEVAEGFENEKLLDLLVGRSRVLLERVKAQDESIDQYHEQEVLLRQQLSARVSVTDKLQSDLKLANTTVSSLRDEVAEQEVGNERLSAALAGYRDEVASLEKLIERVEEEGREDDEALRSEIAELDARLRNEVAMHDVMKADNEGKDMLLGELERRLSAALLAASEVQAQLVDLTSMHTSTVEERDAAVAHLSTISSSIGGKDAIIAHFKTASSEREKTHGSALALRDARVSELRQEIDRVNTSLKVAHSTILALRKENAELTSKLTTEKTRGQFVVRDMLKQLDRAEEMGKGFFAGQVEVDAGVTMTTNGFRRASSEGAGDGQVVVRAGKMFDAGLARRRSSSGKKRRRYDSGLGFLEEEGEERDVEI